MASLRRIDSHFHTVVPAYTEVALAAGIGPTRGRFPDWSPEAGIELMDANDIETAITSVPFPGFHYFPADKARELARKCNDYAADLCARWPKRYGAFAAVPMHDPKHAINEIDYAFDVLKFDGVCLLTSYGDGYLGDAKFDPVFEALNERKAVVYTHPAYSAKVSLQYPGSLLEYPTDTSRMAMHLMFTGALKRFSGIRIILSHAGGTLPYLAWRLFNRQVSNPDLPPQWTYDQYCTALRRFWYDTAMSVGPEMLKCLFSIVGTERVVFGSDWPYMNDKAVDIEVKGLAAPGLLSDAQAAAIARGNALSLFPRLRTQ
jgi:predicted TIM-barrel fold metal-dependent hydrolase